MKKTVETDIKWMTMALEEAKKGAGRTAPNPMVGAVLVRGNKKLATGFHRKAGFPHAEIEALKKVKNPKESTLYVTLEPCCHTQKRTPPCVDAIVEAGIKRVVVGCRDPNPKVSGKGIQFLRKAGIEVTVGVLQEECSEANLFYNHWVKTGKPWVILKIASSLDGKTALASGESKWITSTQSRERVHQLRSESDAILVGLGTILVDNPRLTARLKREAPQPIRIVLDPNLEIPDVAKVLKKTKGAECWVITRSAKIEGIKAQRLKEQGVTLLPCPENRLGGFDLDKLLDLFGKRGLLSVFIEGGPDVWTSFLRERVFDEIYHFVAPRVLGGDAREIFGTLGIISLKGSSFVTLHSLERVGPDGLLRYRAVKKG